MSIDARLKRFLIGIAKRRGVYPVNVLEDLVREKFNPYGHTDISESTEYVRMLRRRSRRVSDGVFLQEIKAWQRSASS